MSEMAACDGQRNGTTTLQDTDLIELINNKRRVEGILSVCTLEHKLGMLLECVMIDDTIVTDFTGNGRRFVPFSRKVELAYALGLIPKDVRDDLDRIGEIRNKCAHDEKKEPFNESDVREKCESLSNAKKEFIDKPDDIDHPKPDSIDRPKPDAMDLFRYGVTRIANFLSNEVKVRANTKGEFLKELESLQSRYEHMPRGI